MLGVIALLFKVNNCFYSHNLFFVKLEHYKFLIKLFHLYKKRSTSRVGGGTIIILYPDEVYNIFY